MDFQLPKIVSRRGKRLGQGYGSGKGGHTVGRGQKGQKARGKIGILFEGIKVKKSLLKKLPFRRGRGKFGHGTKPIIVKLSALNLLASGADVDLAALTKAGIVATQDAKIYGIKVLGDGGEITKKLTVRVPISQSAAKVIIAAGGKVEKI